ncbi:MAG: hypothetical protein ACYTXE_39135 [Nostoc sp.]
MNKNNNVMKKKIQTLLRKALLQDAKMEYELFEYELKEHINYWYKGLKADQEELVFAVTENSGYVAMVLITKEKIIYVNEDAREKLAQLWQDSYKKNIERLLPMMADNLANNIISVNGVKISSGTPKPFFLEQKLLP